MAAQSKTTAVHFSLIIFVMLSVILGVVALLFYNDFRNQEAQFKQNQSELRDAQAAVRQQGEEVAALKKAIGIEAEEVGLGGAGQGTVLGQAKQAIQTLGTNASSASMLVALRDLRNEVNNKTTILAQRDATIADLQAQLAALDAKYKTVAQQHDDKRQMSEKDLAGVQAKANESIAAKDKEIDALLEQTQTLQTELANTKEQMGTQLAEAEEQIGKLLNNVRRLQAERDKLEGMSFEVADGKIVNVDQVGRTVWINLGEQAGLRPGITFSIYAQSNKGIGRENPQGGRPEDIKGMIEVTEILGDKMAEARILSEDGSRPIADGDPIYTPLWGVGQTDKFAFIGNLDIDGDGNYAGDRERLHEIIEANGAEISSELLVTGERRGGEINHKTRFLVEGDIPTVDEVPPEKRQALKELNAKVSAMKREAEVSGVRLINLSSFLDFIGFVPQQNRFVPGESREWTLKAGAPEPSTRESSGNTSKLFDTRRSRPNPSSGAE